MSPRRVLAAGALVAMALASSPLRARAGELDELFDALRSAPDAASARTVEQRIWDRWLHSGDEQVDEVLHYGIVDMEAGEVGQAVEQFSRVIELKPDFAEGWNKRATAYYLLGRLEESVADIQRTLALEPRHFGALSGMGLIFLQRGDLLGALEAFQEVLRIDPRSESARSHVNHIRQQLRGRAA